MKFKLPNLSQHKYLTWIVAIIPIIVTIVFFVRKKKKKNAIKDVESAINSTVESKKDFKKEAELLYQYMGIDSGAWYIPNWWSQTFNGHDDDIVELLDDYSKVEFFALEKMYKTMYDRILLADLEVAISPLEFNKIKNIFYGT